MDSKIAKKLAEQLIQKRLANTVVSRRTLCDLFSRSERYFQTLERSGRLALVSEGRAKYYYLEEALEVLRADILRILLAAPNERDAQISLKSMGYLDGV